MKKLVIALVAAMLLTGGFAATATADNETGKTGRGPVEKTEVLAAPVQDFCC